MDDINLGLYLRPWLCQLGLTTNYMDCSGARFFTVELLWTVFYLLLPPPTSPPVVYCRYACMYAVIMHSCTSSLVVRMHISFSVVDSLVCLVLNNFLIYYIFDDKERVKWQLMVRKLPLILRKKTGQSILSD